MRATRGIGNANNTVGQRPSPLFTGGVAVISGHARRSGRAGTDTCTESAESGHETNFKSLAEALLNLPPGGRAKLIGMFSADHPGDGRQR